MRQRTHSIVLLVFLVGMAQGCRFTKGKQSDQASSSGPPKVAVDVTSVSRGEFADALEVVGSLSPKYEAHVKSEYQGIIERIYVTEWVRVKKGDPLAKLDTREVEVALQRAKAQLEATRALSLKAQVAANRAKRELERLSKLKDVGLVTQQNLDDAHTAEEAAEAEITAVTAQIKASEEDVRQMETRLSKAVLRSPMDGVVAERRPSEGDLVGDPTSSAASFRIVDNRILNLTLDVPSTKLAYIKVGQTLTFSTEAIPGREFSGRISFINPSADATSRSVRIIAEVNNEREELRSGLYAKARINTGQMVRGLQIPRNALLTWDTVAGRGEILVVEGELARRRTIQLGRVEQDRVEVVNGLNEGQQVVTRGAFNVHDGDRVQVTRPNGA
ncbi:MAG TPA: efflux RND transporter periplasmic adaptor subunit [Terriglobia bacterium]|nr:efflux RND transporter periplasmic adaptor subunit [Terriglobia bacterium]